MTWTKSSIPGSQPQDIYFEAIVSVTVLLCEETRAQGVLEKKAFQFWTCPQFRSVSLRLE